MTSSHASECVIKINAYFTSSGEKEVEGSYFPETDLDSDFSIIAEMKTWKLATSLLHTNGPVSTKFSSLPVLCGSVADLHPDWQPLCPREPRKQWEATSLCGSQPPMMSPSLFSHCYFRISTHSFSIPLGPPPYRSTLSHYSSSDFSN